MSFRLRVVRPLIWVLLALATQLGAVAVAQPVKQGETVLAVLRRAQADGLTLIFNDQLVPASLRVLREPASTGGIPLLVEILAPHGLGLRQVAEAAWAVIADPSAKPTSEPPSQVAEIGEIVVTARYALAQREPPAPFALSQGDISAQPRMADEPLRAVHRLPAAASNGVSGLPNIRGGEENETQIVVDGMVLTEPFHLKNFFSPVSVLDTAIVDSMDVYAGGFPAQFGNRMSAVTDVSSIDPGLEGAYQLGLSLFHTSAFASDSFAEGDGDWLFSVRRSNLSEVLNLAHSDFGEPRYADAFAKVGFDFSDATSGTMHLLVSRDELELTDVRDDEESRTTYRNIYLWGTLDHRWSDSVAGTALLSYTAIDNDRAGRIDQVGEQVGFVDDQRDYWLADLRLGLQIGSDDLLTSIGVEAGRLKAHYDYSSTFDVVDVPPFPPSSTTRDLAPTPDGYQYSAYVSTRWRMTPRFTGELGMRWDEQTYDKVDGGSQLGPRVNLLYDIGAQTQLRASWGRFYQAQGIDELQVEDGIDTFSEAQRADHTIVSLQHAMQNGLIARIELYYKDYEELNRRFENLFAPFVLLPELQADRVEIDPIAASARGVEVMLNEKGEGPWSWWITYTWSRAEDDVEEGHVVRSWDQRHSVNAGLAWAKGPWDVMLAGTYHSGWPTTPAVLAPESEGEPATLILAPRNSARLGNFKSLDLRAAYTFSFTDSELSTFLEVTNLLGQKNPCCAEYSLVEETDGSTSVRQELDYWPRFVPNLGVLWKF